MFLDSLTKMSDKNEGVIRVNENEGIIAVGSLAELANLLANMTPDQLKNVQLDPILYNALSQTIEPELQFPIDTLDIPEIDMSSVSIVSDVSIPLEEIVSNAIILPDVLGNNSISAAKSFNLVEGKNPLISTEAVLNSTDIMQEELPEKNTSAEPLDSEMHSKDSKSNLKKNNDQSQVSNKQSIESKNINIATTLKCPEPESVNKSNLKINLPLVSPTLLQKQKQSVILPKKSDSNSNTASNINSPILNKLSFSKQISKLSPSNLHAPQLYDCRTTPLTSHASASNRAKNEAGRTFDKTEIVEKELNVSKVSSLSSTETLDIVSQCQVQNSAVHDSNTNQRCNSSFSDNKVNEGIQMNTARVSSVLNNSHINYLDALKCQNPPCKSTVYKASKLVESNNSVSYDNTQVKNDSQKVFQFKFELMQNKNAGNNTLPVKSKLSSLTKNTNQNKFQISNGNNITKNRREEVDEVEEIRKAIISSKVSGEEALRELAKLEIENQMKRFNKNVPKISKKEEVKTESSASHSSTLKNEAINKDLKNREAIDSNLSSKKVQPSQVNKQKNQAEEPRKRARPKKFDDFIFQTEVKREKTEIVKEKKNRYFFPSSCAETIKKPINTSDVDLQMNGLQPEDNCKVLDGFEHSDCQLHPKMAGINLEEHVENLQADATNGKLVTSIKADEENNSVNASVAQHSDKKKLQLCGEERIKHRKKRKKKTKIAFEPEVLPEHLKKPKAKPQCNPVIDLNKVRLKSAYDESNFLLDNTVEIEVFKALHRTKWECTMCGKPGNIGDLDVLFGPYKINIKESDDTMEVWLHRDCAIWTSTICLANQLLCGVGDALQHAAKTVHFS